jgi:hypothetical protein
LRAAIQFEAKKYPPHIERRLTSSEPSQEEVWHRVISSGQRLYRHWRHHPMKWFEEGPLFLAEVQHLHEYASDPARHFPGLIVSDIGWIENEYLATATRRLHASGSRESQRGMSTSDYGIRQKRFRGSLFMECSWAGVAHPTGALLPSSWETRKLPLRRISQSCRAT